MISLLLFNIKPEYDIKWAEFFKHKASWRYIDMSDLKIQLIQVCTMGRLYCFKTLLRANINGYE